MTRYKRKPVEVEAIQFTGRNLDEVIQFCGGRENLELEGGMFLFLKLPTGKVLIKRGDYIVKGVIGKFYPYGRDRFEQEFEEVKTFNLFRKIWK